MNTMWEVLNQPGIARIGWALLHSLWQGALAALLFALVRLALRKRSAQARYVAGCSTLLLVAIAPVITACGWINTSAPQPGWGTGLAISAGTAPASPALTGAFTARGGTASLVSQILDGLEQALPWLVVVWGVGVVGFAGRWIRGSLWVRRIKRAGTSEVDGAFHSRLAELKSRLQISRPVLLLKSTIVEVPVVVGWLRPVILLPASMLSGLTPTEIEVILAHELAHIRRFDYLVNTFQNLVETVMFYHPAVWWISACIREEREHCCDDLVVEVCGNRLAYARALVSLEELRGVPRLAFAASGGSLLARIRRLLGGAADARPLGPREYAGLTLAGVGCLLLACGAVLLFRPPMFEATAVIRVEADKETPAVAFFETEAAVMRSPIVLGPVIESFGLGGAREADGKATNVTRRVTLGQVESALEIRPEGNSRLMKIRFRGRSAEDAARVVNGVAKTYQDYRLRQRDRAAQDTLQVIEMRVERLDREIQEAEKRADELRAELRIPDRQADAAGASVSAEALRRVEGLRIESQAELTREKVLLAKLKVVKTEDLYQVLHTVSPSDGLANSLVQGLVAAEQKVNELSAEFGPQHPEVVKAVARVKDYQERLRKRAEGFMLGLEAKTASLENSIETLQHEVESVQRREAESASRARPYWEARRKVDQLVELRRVFALKLATEQTESKFYRTPAVEIVEEAVATGRPSTTRAPGAACVLLGLLLAVVGSWVARSGNG